MGQLGSQEAGEKTYETVGKARQDKSSGWRWGCCGEKPSMKTGANSRDD